MMKCSFSVTDDWGVWPNSDKWIQLILPIPPIFVTSSTHHSPYSSHLSLLRTLILINYFQTPPIYLHVMANNREKQWDGRKKLSPPRECPVFRDEIDLSIVARRWIEVAQTLSGPAHVHFRQFQDSHQWVPSSVEHRDNGRDKMVPTFSQ